MTSNTLTSLAILKVNIDQGKDYLDYLRPFILQVLVDHKPDPITNRVVSEYIYEQFGLKIPERAIEIVLKRISRKHFLKRDHGIYRITGDLPDPQIAAKQSGAKRHIDAVLWGLRQFSQDTIKPISSDEDAVISICAFLAKFDIICLRAYLQGTAIPSLGGTRQTNIVLVSDYIQHMQRTDPERFESFLVLVQGHMLANALLCPDLRDSLSTFKGVTFYFDTPLLVQSFGVEGEAKQAATNELIDLLISLEGEVAAFSHSRDELQRVLEGAAAKIDAHEGRGHIIFEARRQGTTKSDLLLLAGQIDEELTRTGIQVKNTPRYIKDYQIDERVFEQMLDDEISYFNERARDYDINSVRSIHALRKGTCPPSIEKSQAIFVTSNSAFARAAWQYGQQYEISREVSSVITNFSLANVAWLKAPMGAPQLPKTEILAFSYAALQPSSELLNNYLTEIDRLENTGKISARDHQILRSDPRVYDELVDLTLGDETSLTEETVTETLKRISREIRKEETGKLDIEKEAHRKIQDKLTTLFEQNEKIQKNLYWRCRRRSKICSWIPTSIISLLLVLGFLVNLGVQSTATLLKWGFTAAFVVFALCALGNVFLGSTVKLFHDRVQKWCLTWLLKRESAATGVDLTKFNNNG